MITQFLPGQSYYPCICTYMAVKTDKYEIKSSTLLNFYEKCLN
jgi:hypothetical protein